ncbi:hypothetical protein SCA6_011250 [Theobroma cacao]
MKSFQREHFVVIKPLASTSSTFIEKVTLVAYALIIIKHCLQNETPCSARKIGFPIEGGVWIYDSNISKLENKLEELDAVGNQKGLTEEEL